MSSAPLWFSDAAGFSGYGSPAVPTALPVPTAETGGRLRDGGRSVFPLMLDLANGSNGSNGPPACPYPVVDGSAQGLAGLLAVSGHLRNRHFAELSHDLLCVIGLDGCFQYASPAWQSLCGYEEAELRGSPCSRFVHPDDRESFAVLGGVASTKGPVSFQNRLRCKDGTYRWLDWRARVVPEHRLIYAAAQDVTEQKAAREQTERALRRVAEGQRALREAARELEQSREALSRTRLQLIQAEKLEAIGRLAPGIAHEVKNPLAVVRMGIDVLSREFGAHAGRAAEVLNAMRHAAQRAESIARGLMNLAAPAELKLKLQDLNRVVDQSLAIVRHAFLTGRVEVAADLAQDLPHVALDAPKVEQVLINVFLNAAQSMAKCNGGRLTVKTFTRPLADLSGHVAGRDRARLSRAGGAVVVVEIDDAGPGIPPDILARLFEPFFTTKPAGQGTGLGLAVSRQIMELHGGTFSLANRPEGGARATLTFMVPTRETSAGDGGNRDGHETGPGH